MSILTILTAVIVAIFAIIAPLWYYSSKLRYRRNRKLHPVTLNLNNFAILDKTVIDRVIERAEQGSLTCELGTPRPNVLNRSDYARRLMQVDLQNAACQILDLAYDEESNTLQGKVKMLYDRPDSLLGAGEFKMRAITEQVPGKDKPILRQIITWDLCSE